MVATIAAEELVVIWVVDSDPVMAECIARAAGTTAVRIYHNVIEAIEGLNEGVPELIFLEVMLTGPDGFTLLNELMSYEDTMRVPVVLVTGLETAVRRGRDLSAYGVVGVLDKATMRPEEIQRYVTMRPEEIWQNAAR